MEEAEKLLAIYCSGNISAEDRFVYYSYIALGGFLWCLWAVYKSSIGDEFGRIHADHVPVRQGVL